MTAVEFTNLLRDLQQADPLRRITVELKSGKRVEVDRLNALVVREGVAVFIAPGGIPHWFDHESVNQIS